MKEVTVYETSDGNWFSSKTEAEDHEAEIEFEVYYNNDRYIYGDTPGCSIDYETLKEWMVEHSQQVRKWMDAVCPKRKQKS